jgi:catecholate siderophore receptor
MSLGVSMGSVKTPLSLRSLGAGIPPARRRDMAGKVAMVTVAGLAAAASTSGAQTTGQGTQFPPLTVEAPAEAAPPARRPAPAARRAPAAGPRTPAASTAAAQPAAAPAAPPAPGAGGTNPNAQPGAPYKVNRSGNAKYAKPLVDTPKTVVAIPKEVIEAKGATSFRELVRTLPGVTIGTGENGNAFGDRIFIRGFDARSDVYVDGMRDTGLGIRENFGTEQVEISKGPDSTINGRGTTGGAVNITTKKAAFDNFTEASVTLGTDATRRGTLDVNRTVGDFAIRGNLMGQLADVAGRDYVFDNRWGGAVSLVWKPSDDFQASVDYYRVRIDQLPDWGVPFDAATKAPKTEVGLDRSNFYGVKEYDWQKAGQDIFTAGFEWKISDAYKLTSRIRVGNGTLDYLAHGPGSQQAGADTILDTADDTISLQPHSRKQSTGIVANQTDLDIGFDTGPFAHKARAGVEVSQEKMWRAGYSGANVEINGPPQNVSMTCANISFWNPDSSGCAIPDTFVLGDKTRYEVLTLSGYLLDSIDLTNRLTVNGGIRIDDYDLTYTPPSGDVLTRHDTMVNYNVGALYKITPDWRVYASYGTSTNPVGAEFDSSGNDYGGIAANNAALGPERNNSTEIGVKYESPDRRWTASLALFRTEKENARETVPASGGNPSYIDDTGTYVVQGIEGGISGYLTERFQVFGGFVFMQSEVTKSMTPANVGLQLANIAHSSFNLLGRYALTEAWSVGGQATWRGEVHGGTFAANQNVLPARWRFDAFAEYRINQHFTVKAAVNNIFDEVIYDAFYRSPTPYVYIAPGRSATLTLNAKF